MTRALIFKSSWGWMGVAESREGLAAIVLPQTSRWPWRRPWEKGKRLRWHIFVFVFSSTGSAQAIDGVFGREPDVL